MGTNCFRYQRFFRGHRNETAAMAMANRDIIVKEYEKHKNTKQ